MVSDAGFDPIFNAASAPREEKATRERGRFLFDGWSYEPLAAPPEKRADALLPQHR